jgi:hypothetical protein
MHRIRCYIAITPEAMSHRRNVKPFSEARHGQTRWISVRISHVHDSPGHALTICKVLDFLKYR